MREKDSVGPIAFKASVKRLPRKGMPVIIDADDRQRKALADAHGLVSVERFHAELLVAPWKRDGVKVTGHVEADITQECVVTLDPVTATVNEDVEGLFLPADSKLGRQGFAGGGELLVDADGPDIPEIFTGDTIDVGGMAEEFFGLGIDPYPRTPDAVLVSGDEDESSSPSKNPLEEKLRQLTRKS